MKTTKKIEEMPKTRNLREIKKALELKAIPFEMDEDFIGIKNNNSYFWFNIYKDEMSCFSHSYNQNTGAKRKSTMTGYNAKKSISKKIGLNIL